MNGADPLPSAAVTIDAALAAFVQGGVTIVVASRDARHLPSIARGRGCRVSPDGRTVALLMPASQCGRLIEDIAASGEVAVVFSEASTHRTVQLKGRAARVCPPSHEPLVADTAGVTATYRAALRDEFARVGFDAAYVEALLHSEPHDLVAVAFEPRAAFTQTPGPNAGAPLGLGR
jgi:hypothetical protein